MYVKITLSNFSSKLDSPVQFLTRFSGLGVLTIICKFSFPKTIEVEIKSTLITSSRCFFCVTLFLAASLNICAPLYSSTELNLQISSISPLFPAARSIHIALIILLLLALTIIKKLLRETHRFISNHFSSRIRCFSFSSSFSSSTAKALAVHFFLQWNGGYWLLASLSTECSETHFLNHQRTNAQHSLEKHLRFVLCVLPARVRKKIRKIFTFIWGPYGREVSELQLSCGWEFYFPGNWLRVLIPTLLILGVPLLMGGVRVFHEIDTIYVCFEHCFAVDHIVIGGTNPRNPCQKLSLYRPGWFQTGCHQSNENKATSNRKQLDGNRKTTNWKPPNEATK